MNEFQLRRLEADLEAAYKDAEKDLDDNMRDTDARVTAWATGYLDGIRLALHVARLGDWRQGETL